MATLRSHTFIPLAALGFLGLSCTADLSASGADGPSGASQAEGDTPGDGPFGPGTSREEAEEIASGLPWPVEFDGASSIARRLTRDELVASLSNLLAVSPARGAFPEEPRSGHGLLLTSGLRFIDSEVRSLWPTVQAFSDGAAPEVLVASGCASAGAEQATCLAGWAHQLAERAFRRALTEDERAKLESLVAGAGVSAEEDQILVAGVIMAVVFSPSFLFRFEWGDPGQADSLSNRALAERISFLATLGPPDAELLSAADAGLLQDGAERAAQYNRLSALPSGQKARAVFLLEWLNANESKVAQKSAEYLEGLAATFPEDIRASVEQAISDVLAGQSPTVSELLSTTNYLSHPAVAAVTAPANVVGRGSGDDPSTDRKGLLMHPYVVASHTKENGSSPFQIGIALREALLCAEVAAPPPGAQDAARENPPAGLTQRETLEYVTSAEPVCSNCHAQFAPMGYAFLPLDPVGRWLSTDPTGKVWDLSGEVPSSSGELLSFSSPTTLSVELGSHEQVLGCFTQAAVQWTFGRKLMPRDAALVASLNDVSQASNGHFFDVFEALVASDAFTYVSSPE